jgi:hypothetical protein
MTKEVFQLEVQVTTAPALTGLNLVDKKLKDIKDSSEKIGKGASASGINSLTTATKGLTSALSGLGSIIALVGFGKIVSETVQSIAAFETLNTILDTVTGSSKGAADALALIQTVSKQTSFSIQEIGASFINLQANGIKPTESQLKLFADVASVTGNKVQALTAITNLFARNMQGGLGIEDLNILANQGIPVYDILAKKLGVARLQIAQLGQTAEGARLILGTLQSELGSRFGGQSEKNLQTLSGQFDLLKNNLIGLGVAVGEGGTKQGLTDLVKSINDLTVALKPLATALGGELGTALKGIGTAVTATGNTFRWLNDHLLMIASTLAVVAAAFFMPEIAAFVVSIRVLITGIGLLIRNWAALMEGLSVSRAIWVAITEVIETLGGIFSRAGGKAIYDWIAKSGEAIAAATPKWLQWAAAILGVGYALEKSGIGKAEPGKTILPPTGAGGGRGNGAAQLADYQKQQEDSRLLALQLLTNRDQIISKIVKNLQQETAVIGLNKQKAEEQNKIYEAQAQIRDTLSKGIKRDGETQLDFEKRIDAEASSLVQAKAGEIRAAVAAKYTKELQWQLKQLKENADFELGMIGKSSNEIERQTKLREQLVALGIKDTATTKQKADLLAQIVTLQDARINESLSKNLIGIQKETEYLKLGNEEREKRIALDQAASDAGFKNAEELNKSRPQQATQIREAIGVKVQTGIDVEGRKQIDQLKEESGLLAITNELDREREKKKLDIYKAIDPEGKGKKVNEAQKAEIDILLAQIEAQNRLLDVNKKIEDSFSSLGDAVSKWALGSTNGIQQVKLELLKLITLEAFKYVSGGMPTGASGSFINGILGGLSGARAEGGPVSSGKSYLVGEKRPEVFVPSTNGYIVPNTAMLSTTTGATHVTMSPNLIIHGSVTGQTELENMFDQFATAMAQETKNFVISQRGQNGILAR